MLICPGESTMPTTSRRPNVLIIVMDCVRESDFAPNPSSNYLPFASDLAKESVRFTRAVSPASWTLPSHASLFTGFYQWEHGLNTFGSFRLSPSITTLTRILRQAGYASLSMSSNCLIDSESNLVGDFDRAYWGKWWEAHLRLPPQAKHRVESLMERGCARRVIRRKGNVMTLHNHMPTILKRFAKFIVDHTYLIDFFQRFLVKLNDNESIDVVSPWIEPTLEKWLKSQPSEIPVFCFINFLDAHEPYFSSSEVILDVMDWLRYAKLRQDRQRWLEGKWLPTSKDLELLHELYRHSLNIIDRRLKRICEIFKEAGRWNETLLVLTSDHGQAFGEHGHMFHMNNVSDEQVRIPLWIRYPDHSMGGKVLTDWVSLVDVMPTVLDVANLDCKSTRSGSSLKLQNSAHQRGPVFAIYDGSICSVKGFDTSSSNPKSLCLAVFKGKWKVVVDLGSSNPPRAYDIVGDPKEEFDLWDKDNLELRSLAEAASNVVMRPVDSRQSSPSPEVLQRLVAWGYA